MIKKILCKSCIHCNKYHESGIIVNIKCADNKDILPYASLDGGFCNILNYSLINVIECDQYKNKTHERSFTKTKEKEA